MVRGAIRISAYHSYRDQTSLELIEGSETNLRGVVVADLARNLDFCSRLRQTAAGPVTVGINPMPVYDERYWFHGDKTRYSSYVDKIADLAHRLVDTGAQVFFFPTHPSDERVIDDVLAVLRNQQRPTTDAMTRKSPKSVQELMGVIQEADVIIPTRFHGVVLSLVAERLVLGICYQQKSADVLNAAGQQDYHVMLDRLEVSDLMSRFDRLWSSRDTARRLIRQSNERAREELSKQYHYLESFVAGSSDARV
jgi:polysaccharide pyruvyl transferase WcaK-like protein